MASGNKNQKVQNKANNKKRKKRKIVFFIIEIIILLCFLLGLFIFLKLNNIEQDKEIKKEDIKKNELTEETQETFEKFTTIAIFGIDNTGGTKYVSGNSDVLIIAVINNETKKVKMASVYRDTYLNIADESQTYHKANEAYNEGGAMQTLNMLNLNLDLDIKDYIAVDFNAVAVTIDLLGGIDNMEISEQEAVSMRGFIDEVAECSNKEANYLPGAGTYTLDGVQATAYARVRQTSGDDFKRTERQRLVISKMVEKALASDLTKLNEVADGVMKEIKTTLSYSDILLLLKDALSYSLDESIGFPQDYAFATVKLKNIRQEQECVVPLDLSKNVKALHEFLYESEDYEVTESVKKINDEISYITGKRLSDVEN